MPTVENISAVVHERAVSNPVLGGKITLVQLTAALVTDAHTDSGTVVLQT